MHRPLRFLAAALVAALASPALATNGMRMTGFGAVQNGMGGVGVAATLDSSTIVTNPAGLTDLDRRFDASLTWFQPSVEYKATSLHLPPPNPPAFLAQDGVTFTSNRGGSPIPNLGVVLPIGHGFTAGVGAFGVGGMGVDYDSNLYFGKTVTSYSYLRLAPAIAYKPNDEFSFGVALNLAWAQMKFDVASGFGQVPHDTANAFGTGVTVGMKIRPAKTVALGISYETMTAFSDFKFSIPSHDVPDGAGGSVTLPGGTDTLRFHQPSVLSFGLAWQTLPELLVSTDVQFINWKESNGPNKPVYQNDTRLTGALPFNMSWSPQVVYKVGLQYEVTPGWKARAGWNYGKNPLDASRAFENIAFPAIAEHHLALGLGWDVTSTLAVNVGVTYAPKVTLTGSNPAQGIASYQTSMSQIAGDLGVGWKF